MVVFLELPVGASIIMPIKGRVKHGVGKYMSYELMLLRHGKSDWSIFGADYDRPLAKRGKRDARQVGLWLSRRGLEPDLIVTSPAKRARSTARRAAVNMGMEKGSIIRDGRIYAADVSDLLQIIRECPASAGRVMLVGHNPGFEELVEYLADTGVKIPQDGKLMPTATLALMTLAGGWDSAGAGSVRLEDIVRPAAMVASG
jgi:phosphohistidine phosphatase